MFDPMTDSAHVSMLSRLEGLPGRFASNLLRLEAQQLDGAITGMLEMAGAALGADWATLEEYPDCAGKSGAARAWRRPGADVPGEPALVLPVHAGSRHICTFSFGNCAEDPSWPVDVVERLRPVADLVAMAIERQSQDGDGAGAKVAAVRMGKQDHWYHFDQELRPSNFGEIIGDSPALRVAI